MKKILFALTIGALAVVLSYSPGAMIDGRGPPLQKKIESRR